MSTKSAASSKELTSKELLKNVTDLSARRDALTVDADSAPQTKEIKALTKLIGLGEDRDGSLKAKRDALKVERDAERLKNRVALAAARVALRSQLEREQAEDIEHFDIEGLELELEKKAQLREELVREIRVISRALRVARAHEYTKSLWDGMNDEERRALRALYPAPKAGE